MQHKNKIQKAGITKLWFTFTSLSKLLFCGCPTIFEPYELTVSWKVIEHNKFDFWASWSNLWALFFVVSYLRGVMAHGYIWFIWLHCVCFACIKSKKKCGHTVCGQEHKVSRYIIVSFVEVQIKLIWQDKKSLVFTVILWEIYRKLRCPFSSN